MLITLPSTNVCSPEIGAFGDFKVKPAKGAKFLRLTIYFGSQHWTIDDVKIELAGETEVGRWLLEPSIKFGYTQDESKGAVAIWSRAYGYDDIGQVDVSEGRVELAQKVSYPINAGRFTFVPSLKVSGIWLFDSPDYVESISSDGETIVTSDERFAARVEAALQLTDEDSSASAGLSIFYEGTTTDHDAFGISLRGKIPLNK
ncbi:MAG: hypothetical protein AAGD43_01785 [Pseudomonadota bacterium]